MPKKVGKYELGRTLGSGTFGKVKFGVNSETGEQVAIKILDKEKIQQNNMGAQIKKEISIMKMIAHPNVVRLFEVLASRSKIFIVLELVTGGELFDKIVAEGRFKESMARFYFKQLMEAVKYCHDQGVAHRDLKPENLLLDAASHLKISDFGLSALYTGADGDTSRATLLHTTCGTPNYVAPEVLQDKGYDGAAADIWSCGVILYVLRAGFLPFDEVHMSALFKKIQKAEYVFPDWFEPELKDLIERILVPDPSKRYGLEDILGHPWLKGPLESAAGPVEADGAAAETAPEGPAATGGAGAGAGAGEAAAAKPASAASLTSPPSAKDVAEAVAEGVKEEGDDEGVPVLNAFEVVNLFGSLSLNRMLAGQATHVGNNKFVTERPPAEVLDKAASVLQEALGGDVRQDKETCRLEAEVLTKNGAIGVNVQLYKMTDSMHLVEIERGRGDILAFKDTFITLRKELEPLVASSEEAGEGAAAGGAGT